MELPSTTIVGFDSAWADNPLSPGAICALRISPGGAPSFAQPECVSFATALQFIDRERAGSEKCLVAIDQPTIVPNGTGSRPVDRVAGSMISWLGGGVQPASRARLGMFDDAAPFWRFKEALGAIEHPERARQAATGVFLMEVFPALAMPSIERMFFGRKSGPRYNPERRKTFRLEHWQGVVVAITCFARDAGLTEIARYTEQVLSPAVPRKIDQDKLDAVVCALIGWIWLFRPRSEAIMIGDLESGYMISPASQDARARLEAAALIRRVPVDALHAE